ncbi:MAG: SDR family oxidoreductase [Lentisphaerae bacterium]|nr:SDR family oxidoreductase [Lentisphaerota bacterium]
MSRNIISFDLKGRKALVTGGNTGIGLAIAHAMLSAGAIVAISGRNPDKNKAALKSLKDYHTACRSFIYDLNDISGIPQFYQQASDEMNGIDVLVNNAGAQCRGRAENIKSTDFEQILRVNLTAPFVLSQCFAQDRIARKQPGNIIMIASLMSEAARPTTAPYTASKGGIKQLIKALAVDWAQFGIRVNGIGPGYIKTEMTRPLAEDPEFDKWVRNKTPLGRWGSPNDISGTAVFLASDAAAFITGQIIYVDGGWLASF